jgi:hypothetical protein
MIKKRNKKNMKVKRIKLYDGYITINQDPTKAFDSNILHLRKMGKNYYAKKRSKPQASSSKPQAPRKEHN